MKNNAKLLVGHLRAFLTELISPHQVSFTPDRHVTDNIVMTQEVFHTYRKTKGRKCYMACKIDLAKTYDKLI